MTVRVVVRLVASARSDSRNLVDTGELAQVARAAERLDDSSRNDRWPISESETGFLLLALINPSKAHYRPIIGTVYYHPEKHPQHHSRWGHKYN